MSKTESTMVELGTKAPPFELMDVVTGQVLSRDQVVALEWGGIAAGETRPLSGDAERIAPRGLLVMFLCVHCPYVKHVEEELARIGRDYEGQIAMAAISSNDVVEFPQDGPEEMKAQSLRLGFRFPYFYDETQEVARAYHAACTPDFFLFDKRMDLVYRGQLDGSRPRRGDSGNEVPVTGYDLRRAISEVIRDVKPSPDQKTSLGCNIKWKI